MYCPQLIINPFSLLLCRCFDVVLVRLRLALAVLSVVGDGAPD